jgi:glycosyltransferase involved in cell wall biosynthesis
MDMQEPPADGEPAAAPSLLFVLTESLGWSTYAARIEQAARRRPELRCRIVRFRYRPPMSKLIKTNNMTGAQRLYRHIDPIDGCRLVLRGRLRRLLQETGARAVHFAAHWLAGAIEGLPGAPPATAIVDHTRAAMERDLPRRVWTAADMRREARLLTSLDHVFALSSWAARSAAEDCGVPADRISVLPPSVEPHETSVRRQGHDGPANIVFIGNDFRRKGGDRLLRWLAGPLAGRATLHIVSRDRHAPASGEGIVNHGAVENRRLVETLLPQMDLICLPTRSDMSSWVVAEAAAAGLPAVASRVSGLLDLVREGETGILVPPDDDAGFVAALASLLDDADRRAAMGAAARRLAEHDLNAQRNYDRLFDRMLELGGCATGTAVG